nr:hypothetical protein CFP56_00830 [Quercus suber]
MPGMDSRHLASLASSYQIRTSFDTHSEHRQRAQKHAANHARPLPANHAISHILDSLDALTPPPVLRRDDVQDNSDSTSSSRPYSDYSRGSAALSATRSISPGSGSRYGAGQARPDDVDDDHFFDPVPPPSVPTPESSVRSPAAPAPSVGTGSPNGISQRGLSPSRKKSFRSKGDKSPVKNKLSAESWVTQTPRAASQTAATEMDGTPDTVRTQRSLRRVVSRESLRPQSADRTPLPELRTLSRAEQIIARSPPTKPTSRGRLYLNEDIAVSDEPASGFTDLTSRNGDGFVHSGIVESTNGDPATASESRLRKRSKSTISDSIPTRTSSLRQPSRSPNPGRKKDKKQKRPAVTSHPGEGSVDVESMLLPRSNNISEASWADLGDDDETVRRIRQLREQRKSRLQASVTPDSTSPGIDSETYPASLSPNNPADSVHQIGAADGRPLVVRALHESMAYTDAQSLSNSYGLPVPAHNGLHAAHKDRSNTSNQWKHIPIPLIPQELPAHSNLDRPSTARTTLISKTSLDYSYTDAMDALQSNQRDQPSPLLATSDPWVKGVDEINSATNPVTRSKSITASSVQVPDRPDQTSEIQRKKSRRKTTNDPRQGTADRPDMQRRDSIDDTISDYLNDPRLSRKVKHPITGRVISFSEVGDPNGAAVFVCVGMGLTRYVTAFYDELATTLRLRLITPDRPGVGRSEPYPSTDRPGPLSWPDDVLAICQELNIQRFSLLAHSAGAIYALATALILPHLVTGKVHLLAPWIPLSQLEATNHSTVSAPPAGALPRGQRFLRVLPTSFFKAANSSFMTATSTSLRPASRRQIEAAKEQRRLERDDISRPPTQPVLDHQRRESMMLMDQFMPTTAPTMPNLPAAYQDVGKLQRGSIILSATALPTDPEFSFASTALKAAEHAERERQLEYTSRLTQRTWDLATRDSNPATDLLVCLERNREIGFRYTDVTREVVITHGSDDKRVPIGNVKWVAEQMNIRAYMGGRDQADEPSLPRTRDDWDDPRRTTGGCEVRVLPGEGHRLMASAPIMSGVLTEIAGYWTTSRIGGPVGGEEKSMSI